jgi:hypothetical protein
LSESSFFALLERLTHSRHSNSIADKKDFVNAKMERECGTAGQREPAASDAGKQLIHAAVLTIFYLRLSSCNNFAIVIGHGSSLSGGIVS